MLAALALVTSLSTVTFAQQTKVYRDGSGWVQEITGTLPASKNLKVKVEAGAVRVQGGNESQISYVIRNRVNTSSEQKARREFDSYKINAGSKGEWAFVTGEWMSGPPKRFSGDFSFRVPRQMEMVKVATEGGSVDVRSIAGR